MIRTVLHTIGAALFGLLYVATWTAVHIGSIAAPVIGSGPSTIGSAGCGPVHVVRFAPTQRRHIHAPKIQISCPDAPPPAGYPTLQLPRVHTPADFTPAAESLLLCSSSPARAPPLS